MKNKSKLRAYIVAAMLSAIAFVLMLFEFPLAFFIPSFIKMDFSDLPALIGAFALSPIFGVIISLLKNLLNLLIEGSSTAMVGEFCNFALGAVFTFTAGAVYHRKKSRKSAAFGALIGAVCMGVLSVPLNFYVTYPAYVEFYGMPLEAILAAYQQILPSVDSLIKALLVFNLPFTIIKGILVALISMLIYKPLAPILKGK